jgi:hypothetical protein
MLKIFLSYALEDGASVAEYLRQELEHADFYVWRDAENTRAGIDWKEQQIRALYGVDVVLAR